MSARAQEESKLRGAADKVNVFGDRAKISHRLNVSLPTKSRYPLIAHFLQIVTRSSQPCNNWVAQVSARTASHVSEPLTRYAIAFHIAKSVHKAFKKCGGVWKLVDKDVRYEDAVLLELVNVGKGSWQIVLAYSV